MKTPPLVILRRRHRAALWGWSLGILLAAALANLILIRLGFDSHRRLPLLIAAAVLAGLARIVRQRPLSLTARELDETLAASNRFEALAGLGTRSDPLAMAMREEASQHLAARRRLRLSPIWSLGCAGLAIVLAVAYVVPPRIEPVATPPAVLVPAAPALAAVPPPIRPSPPAPPPPASLVWFSPLEAIIATPEEIVPLVGQADSRDGLRHLTLQLAINGSPQTPLPLDPELKPGPHPIALPLQLNGLKVHPGDTVTYYLSAERIQLAATQPPLVWPALVSPVQSIKIRAVEDYLAESEPARPISFSVMGPLPPREKTAAGRLDQLVADQRRLSQRISGGAQDPATLREEAEVARQLEQLAGDPQTPPAQAAAIRAAAADAKNAAQQLNENDRQAALEPATRAADTLQTAQQQRDTASQARAVAALQAAQVALIRASARVKSLADPNDTPVLQKIENKQRKPSDVPDDQAPPASKSSSADSTAGGSVNDSGSRSRSRGPHSANFGSGTDNESGGQKSGSSPGASSSGGSPATASASGSAGSTGTAGSANSAGGAGSSGSAGSKLAPSLGQSGGGVIADQAALTAADLHRAAAQEQQSGSAQAAQQLDGVAQTIDRAGQNDRIGANSAIGNASRDDSGDRAPSADQQLEGLGQMAADAQVKLGDGKNLQKQARDELARDNANLGEAAVNDPAATRDHLWHALAAKQVANSGSGDTAKSGNSSQTKGGERTVLSPGLDQRAIGLGHRLSPLPAVEPSSAPERLDSGRGPSAATDLLATGSLDDAPPAYRAAVANYFEGLARESAAPASASSPHP